MKNAKEALGVKATDLINSAVSLPVNGTWGDNFWEKNKELAKVEVFAELRTAFKKEDWSSHGDMSSTIMWYIVYANYSSFFHDGVSVTDKRKALKDYMNIPEKLHASEEKAAKLAESMYRKLTQHRLYRILRAVEYQIDNIVYLLETTQAKSAPDIEKIDKMLKNYHLLKANYESAIAEWDKAKDDVALMNKNNKLLSAADSGELWQE